MGLGWGDSQDGTKIWNDFFPNKQLKQKKKLISEYNEYKKNVNFI